MFPNADMEHTASLPFLAVWLAAHLVLEGCIYIPFARQELRGIFFELPFSLGKCPTMTHGSVVFLILQQA